MNKIRNDFPLIANSSIAYLDSGATSQKPKIVLDKMVEFYEKNNANAYRGVYKLSEKATEEYANARETVKKFINASKSEEIIFTKNATEALNLLAYSYGLDNVKENDKIVISIMEHHSNLVPWQMVAKSKGAKLEYLYLDDDFNIPENELEKIDAKTKIVAITLVSNVLGSVVDVKNIIERAHKVGAMVIVDASQAVAHRKVDVKDLDADFLVFSGHKMYAPLGIGVLYGKKDLLEKMSPFLFGGDMIEYVKEQETTFAPLPHKFEAGTQNVAGAVGLASAIEYINSIGFEKIEQIEKPIIDYAIEKLKALNYITLYSPKENLTGVISFNIDGIHPHDSASFLANEDVCIRSGNHCAQPLMHYLGVDSTCRATISMYNTKEDIDKLISAIEKTYKKFEKYIKN